MIATEIRMTADELLCLPYNGMRRELIAGELRETPLHGGEHGFLCGQVALWLGSFLRSNPDVGGGLFATGRLASESKTGMTVPVSAVDTRAAQPAVFRVKGGKVERVPVQLGIRDESAERIEIQSGVQTGDTLLVGAAQGITPGTVVRVSNPSDRPVQGK